jgi:protein MAK16
LLDRLRSKAYGDAPLNVNEDVWRQVLDLDKGKERDLDLEEESLDEWEEEDDEGGEREFVEDDSEEESVGDLEDYSGSEVRFMPATLVEEEALAHVSSTSSTRTKRHLDKSSRQILRYRTRTTATRTTARRARRSRKRLRREPRSPQRTARLQWRVRRGRERPEIPRRARRDVSCHPNRSVAES